MASEGIENIDYDVKEIFHAWDLDENGFIEKNELASCCSELNLTNEELDTLFKELDVDRDDQISLLDFSNGFQRVCSLFQADYEPLNTEAKDQARSLTNFLMRLEFAGYCQGKYAREYYYSSCSQFSFFFALECKKSQKKSLK